MDNTIIIPMISRNNETFFEYFHAVLDITDEAIKTVEFTGLLLRLPFQTIKLNIIRIIINA